MFEETITATATYEYYAEAIQRYGPKAGWTSPTDCDHGLADVAPNGRTMR